MTKFTCFSRSAVTVNDELPTSNLPAFKPAMIVSKVAFASRPLDSHDSSKGGAEVGVHPDDCRSVGRNELVGRIGGVHGGHDAIPLP